VYAIKMERNSKELGKKPFLAIIYYKDALSKML